MNPMTKRLMTSVLSLISVALIFVFATYAWLNLTQSAESELALSIDKNLYEYRFFVYRDIHFLGNDAPTLVDSVCVDGSEQHCYLEIVDPTPAHLFSEAAVLRPDNRFSFALEITNVSGVSRFFQLFFAELASSGYALSTNKIQRAFAYSVTRIVYAEDGVESGDVKDSGGIVYAGMAPDPVPHFGSTADGSYVLAAHLPIDAGGDQGTMILFFDLYFDPYVEGVDAEGVGTGNSNAFQNQVFIVGKLRIETDED